MLDVYDEVTEQYSDGIDDFNPFTEVVSRLSDADRKQYYTESEYFDSIIPSLPACDNVFEAARPYLIEKFG